MGRVIAVANQKGGVGKTTTAINLAASMAAAEQRTLVVDCDPQGNLTSGLGLRSKATRGTTYDALVGRVPLAELVLDTALEGLKAVPSDRSLTGAEIELVDQEGREFRLRDVVEPLGSSFDYIFLDCPPSLGLLTLNALVAADSVLIPLQCEFYALEGLSELLATLKRVQASFNRALAVEGIVLTMFDDRTNLSAQVATDVRSHFPASVFRSIVPRSVRLAEAPSFGKPILLYDIRSRGAEAYIALAKEIIHEQKKRPR